MRYRVEACICTNFVFVADTLETDDFYEVQEFIEQKCNDGYDCRLVDNEQGTSGWSYASEFYADLRMEQQEQM